MGIGSATAIFSLLNTVLLKPLSYPQPDQLVDVREVVAPLVATYPSLPVNYQHFLFWREHARSFASLAAVQGGVVDLTGDTPIRVGSADVSTNLFSLLGVQPQIGRSFLPEERQKGHGQVVIITDSLWSRGFARAPDLLGKTITVDYLPYRVVGILPPGFRFPKNDDLGPLTTLAKNTDLFMPLTGSYSNGWDGDYDYIVFGRLNRNVSMQQALTELDLLEHQIEAEHHLDRGLRVVCKRLRDVISTPVRTPLYVFMAAVLLLLLIVCVNLANLVLARSSVRSREFSIRTALGAGRIRLIQQVLIETGLLGLAGGALGLTVALLAIRAFTPMLLCKFRVWMKCRSMAVYSHSHCSYQSHVGYSPAYFPRCESQKSTARNRFERAATRSPAIGSLYAFERFLSGVRWQSVSCFSSGRD